MAYKKNQGRFLWKIKPQKGISLKAMSPQLLSMSIFLMKNTKWCGILYAKEKSLWRLSHQTDHEKVGICKLLNDRGMFGTISIAKPSIETLFLNFMLIWSLTSMMSTHLNFTKSMWNLLFFISLLV